MTENRPYPQIPQLHADPHTLTEAILAGDRRVLLVGPPGAGKSTLVAGLATTLLQQGRTCHCLGADPGSPLFGVPGAVCLGRRERAAWTVDAIEALCTLDAGRFRLPLVAAVRRLAATVDDGVLLVDGPGVVRGVAGAELLSAVVEAAAIDVVLVLARAGRVLPLRHELQALPVDVYAVPAAVEASRPGKRARATRRTAQWDEYLANAAEHVLDPRQLALTGTPPPLDVPGSWTGRQVALLDGAQTLAMGEVLALEGEQLRLRLPADVGQPRSLLVRDAARRADGFLGTVEPFAADRFAYLPPPDMAPHAPSAAVTGPRPAGRVGGLSVCLVNGVFGDPLLHVRLRHRRRSLLFDLGEGARLPARIAHQVSDVFISHAHVDHIAGFLWLLRSRIGETSLCRLYGPPGLAANIDGLVRGILWDRVGDNGPRFEVIELHGTTRCRYAVQAGRPGFTLLEETVALEGVMLAETGFRVRAATLDHVSPVLAYVLEPVRDINIRKDRLKTRGLSPGPWLGELKRHLQAGNVEAHIVLPDGSSERVQALADELVLISPGKKLAYATDFADTADNRARLLELVHNAHTLFCEATFCEADTDHAARTAHITTRACAEIAEAAGVARLVPFHFSRRYEKDPAAVYAEIAANSRAVVVPETVVID
jgi:ribonuclease BN (tRNA processing enzyme)